MFFTRKHVFSSTCVLQRFHFACNYSLTSTWTMEPASLSVLFIALPLQSSSSLRLASRSRSVAPRWPRLTARLQKSAGERLLSLRIWSTHLLRGRPGRRFLVDVWAIGQHCSWVPCELERPLATWWRDRRESCDDGWLTLRLTVDSVISSFRMNCCHF